MRLSKIYTRTGDNGETALSDGKRIPKSAQRIKAIGDIDELNAVIGLLRAQLKPDDVLQADLHLIQHQLFNIGGMLATPHAKLPLILAADVTALEQLIDKHNAALPPLKDFILPGGSESVARAHLARVVCRRAERTLVELNKADPTDAVILNYVNRLSDLCFVIGRVIGARTGEKEVLWEKNPK